MAPEVWGLGDHLQPSRQLLKQLGPAASEAALLIQGDACTPVGARFVRGAEQRGSDEVTVSLCVRFEREYAVASIPGDPLAASIFSLALRYPCCIFGGSYNPETNSIVCSGCVFRRATSPPRNFYC